MSKKRQTGRAIIEAVASIEPSAYAWAAGVAINLIAVWGGSLSVTASPKAAANDNESVVLVIAKPTALMPATGETRAAAPELRQPMQDALKRTPAQAVWGYLCHRDADVAPAVAQPCPETAFTDGDLLTLGPLQRHESDAVYGRKDAEAVPTEGPARNGLGRFPWDERFGAANDNSHIDAPKGGQDQ